MPCPVLRTGKWQKGTQSQNFLTQKLQPISPRQGTLMIFHSGGIFSPDTEKKIHLLTLHHFKE